MAVSVSRASLIGLFWLTVRCKKYTYEYKRMRRERDRVGGERWKICYLHLRYTCRQWRLYPVCACTYWRTRTHVQMAHRRVRAAPKYFTVHTIELPVSPSLSYRFGSFGSHYFPFSIPPVEVCIMCMWHVKCIRKPFYDMQNQINQFNKSSSCVCVLYRTPSGFIFQMKNISWFIVWFVLLMLWCAYVLVVDSTFMKLEIKIFDELTINQHGNWISLAFQQKSVLRKAEILEMPNPK